MKKSGIFLIILLFALSLSSASYPSPEGKGGSYTISTIEQLNDKAYAEKIEQLYDEGVEGSFTGKKNVPIYFKYFRQTGDEKGAVVISSGRTEAALKYKEVIYDLYANGYSVYISDHRGQGLSGRMAGDPEMGYVDNFQYYIDDLKYFYDHYVVPGKHRKIYLLAHSLGGAIGMSYLEQFPRDFDAAAFSSPMLGLSAYICPLAHILNTKTPKYAPGQSGYHKDSTSFYTNDVTGCQTRFMRSLAVNDKYPESRLGGASLQWLCQSCDHMKLISKKYEKLETPFIIFLADNETVVNPKAIEKFIAHAQNSQIECKLIPVSDAQHELLMEKDEQRTMVLQESLDLFASN